MIGFFDRYAGLYRDDNGDQLLMVTYADHLCVPHPSMGDYRKLQHIVGEHFPL